MSLLVDGKRRSAENAHQDRAWLAWTIAALGRAKMMPELKDVAGKPQRQVKKAAMSAEQMLTMAHMWSAVAGPQRK